MTRASSACLVSIALGFSCGCSAGDSPRSLVVGDVGTGGTTGGPGGNAGTPVVLTVDAGVSNALSAHIESPPGLTVSFITLSCSDACADVVAVAKDGVPPYSYAWADGSTDPRRHVCPTATTDYSVRVTDTAVTSREFKHAAETVTASLTARVVACPTGTDAGPTPPRDAGFCQSGTPAAPETLTLDVAGPAKYFAGGAPLPAGRYRVEYMDGCMLWGPIPGGYGWAVGEGVTLGSTPEYCVLVGDTTATIVGILPGLASVGVPQYADCVAQSRALPPLEFDFKGGKLGIFNNDTVPFDDAGGESVGGTSPTWRLSMISSCAR